jgi:hypothetical protein
MKDAMVGAAEWNREFVADPAAQCARLGKSQMMSVRRLASAQETRLRGHELQVCAVAIAAGFAERECAFIDMPSDGIVGAFFGSGAYER